MRRTWFLAATAVVVLLTVGAFVARSALRRATSAESIEAKLNASLHTSTDGLYRLTLADTSYDLLRKSFVASRFSLAPDSAAWQARREAGTMPEMRCSIEADALRLDGIDLQALARGRVDISMATLEAPILRIFMNRQAPVKSEPRPASMPHELLRRSPRLVHVDTLTVKNGSVQYSELAVDGARAGTVRFEDIWATIYGLVTDAKPGVETPCRIDLRMLLMGEGRTDLTIEYDLGSEGLDLKYRGRVGRMPASAFNEMLVDLEGLRVKTGRLDSTWFEFDVENDVANGSVQVLYRNLDTEIIDKVTHDQGLKKQFQTFMNSTFRVEGENTQGGDTPALVAAVYRERPARENFFRFLWVIVREGLIESLGV